MILMNNNKLYSITLITRLFALSVLLMSQTAFATEEKSNSLNLEQLLLMPGDLTLAHEEFETQCDSCHDHFEKANQSHLCIDCHEVVQLDLKEKSGFHGKLSKVQIADCQSCHTDHKGRSFDISGLDKDLFDHEQTDFSLKGKHLALGCESCHSKDQPVRFDSSLQKQLPLDKGYRFKEFTCISCHKEEHKPSLGEKCSDCHSATGWLTSEYDHDKSEFKLDEAHKDTECASCHINNQFKGIGKECKSCHLASDAHLGIFGDKCEDCHNSKKWTEATFDHSNDTKSKLSAGHLELNCISCHENEKNPSSICIDCHQSNDIHQGVNGEECQDCHDQKDWAKVEFKHEVPLTGKHLDVNCSSCHTPGSELEKIFSDRSCADCHQAIDPHLGNLGQNCQSCHNTDDWQQAITFNHDFTAFPLTGSHQLLLCEGCHLTDDFSSEETACNSCHKDDDIHKETLGNDCESCHDASAWHHWKFDHQEKTKYPLLGAHENLKCNLCHFQDLPEPLKPDNECASCHLKDDVHDGDFGLDCKQCHSTETFNAVIF